MSCLFFFLNPGANLFDIFMSGLQVTQIPTSPNIFSTERPLCKEVRNENIYGNLWGSMWFYGKHVGDINPHKTVWNVQKINTIDLNPHKSL